MFKSKNTAAEDVELMDGIIKVMEVALESPVINQTLDKCMRFIAGMIDFVGDHSSFLTEKEITSAFAKMEVHLTNNVTDEQIDRMVTVMGKMFLLMVGSAAAQQMNIDLAERVALVKISGGELSLGRMD
jgi:hypothetical protein